MYSEGDKIICKVTGVKGRIITLYKMGVMAEINGYTFARSYSDIMPDKTETALYEPTREDLIALQHLAVETGDKEWFLQLSERLGEKVNG